MSGEEEDVFLDANGLDEETPRRSNRKRRSTAGNSVSTSNKKAKPAKMPTARSPGSKKTPNDPGVAQGGSGQGQGQPVGQDDFWVRMNSMLGGTETRMTSMIGGAEERLKAETSVVREALGEKLDGVLRTVDDLKRRMDEQDARIDKLDGNIDNLVDERVKASMSSMSSMGGTQSDCDTDGTGEIVEKAWGSPPMRTFAAAVKDTSGPLTRQKAVARRVMDPARKREEDYWNCRRAVRIRPVDGGNDMEAVRAYLNDKLRISSSSIDSLGLDRARLERVPFGPKSKVKNEMIVWFPTSEARDVVKAAAKNLSTFGSEYGVRLELPNHLKTTMQNLQAVSFDIKKRHPGARRNVFFDDGAQDLVLDFCTSEGQPWRRVSAKQAKASKAKRARDPVGGRDIGDGELDEILGVGGLCDGDIDDDHCE